MNTHMIWTIMRKDMSDLRRNRNAMIPMFMLPVIMFVVVPIAIILMCYALGDRSINLQGIIGSLPSGVIPKGYTQTQSLAYAILIYYLAPMYMLLPALIANVSASSSFVGEKEHRTLEGLMSSPVTNIDLVVAKSLASMVPTLISSFSTTIFYALIIDGLGYNLFGGMVFPNAAWLIITFITAPLTALLAVCIVTSISQRTNTVMDAQGMGMVVLIPFIGFIAMMVAGYMTLNVGTILMASGLLAIADVIGLIGIAKLTDSENMLL